MHSREATIERVRSGAWRTPPRETVIVNKTGGERPAWKFVSKPVVGVIGGIGGGKSAISARLAERGARVLDADKVGHEVLTHANVVRRLTEEFGPGVLAADGSIDRKKLGAIVFGDEARRKRLESIVHPAMFEIFRRRMQDALDDARVPLLVLDAAILLEAGWDGVCDEIVFVEASDATRRRRVNETRGWSTEELARREAAQLPLDEKRRRADRIVHNDGSIDESRRQADRLFDEITGQAGRGECPASDCSNQN